MKTITHIILCISIISFTPANAQIIDGIPSIDGKVNFNETVTVNGASQNDLFLKSKEFFVNTYQSPKDVVQMEFDEAAVIIGKAYIDINLIVLTVVVETKMWYSIKIQSKEGRYRYEIYDINYEGEYANSTAEEWFDVSSYYKKNGKERNVNAQYKEKTTNANMLIDQVKTSMGSNTLKTTDDW
ncbi:MAG TPA: DUF4468 domain-containing protein [Cyclobacteriaceae bacterium]|nr:DUF4468 domain-containing protein [Cyclobacteriaceae bacterium]